MNQISLYAADTPQNGFDNNGIAVLCPSACVVHEKINDEFSLSLTHPIDEDGIWRTISAFTHIKALGQIFDVKTVAHDYTGRSGKITVYAEHVSYKMNDLWLFPDSVITGNTSNDLIQSAMNAADAVPFPGSVDYTFSFDSDIPVTTGYTRRIENGCTLAEAIIGNGGIQETFGGELYRDNFYFSLKQRMEGSLDNAFEIRVGLNMEGIKRTVDVETFCSYFRAYDHLGQWFAIAYDATSYAGLPIQNSVVRSQNFRYDTTDPDVSMANLEREANFYWWKHLAPKITYEVDLRDIRNNPDFAFISNHYRFKVGDYGRIYDDRLGGALELRITETETDALTGEVIKVVFGDLRGFVKESGDLPLPPFPEIPKKPFVFKENVIAVVLLDENDEPTEDVAYFYKTGHGDARALMERNPDNRYWVRVGKEITTVGTGGAQYCLNGGVKNLVKFTIEGSIDEIWDSSMSQYGAFSNCTSLKYVDLGKSMVNIPQYAFWGCTSLKTVKIPETCTIIRANAFGGCTSITSLSIPNVTKILNGAFANSGLLEIELGSIQTVFAYAFQATPIRSISFPSSIVSIDKYAFRYCENLETITINKPEGSIANAPWGAPNAQVIWTG